MQLDVTVQIEGEDVLAGRLYQNVRHGDETATFSYAASYLDDARALALAPDMPLGPGAFHSEGLRDFRALEDCMPDRWGRNLMLRAERARAREDEWVPRTLFEADMLAGVNDEARQGALRIWDTDGRVLSGIADGVPRETSVPSLLRAADIAASDMDADVRDLLAAGSRGVPADEVIAFGTREAFSASRSFPRRTSRPSTTCARGSTLLCALWRGRVFPYRSPACCVSPGARFC